MPRVVNLRGTGQRRCNCTSWIVHWENHTGKPRPAYCSVLGCGNAADHGAHVRRHNYTNQSHFIVPMCASHNNMYDVVFDLKSYAILVSANQSYTCR